MWADGFQVVGYWYASDSAYPAGYVCGLVVSSAYAFGPVHGYGDDCIDSVEEAFYRQRACIGSGEPAQDAGPAVVFRVYDDVCVGVSAVVSEACRRSVDWAMADEALVYLCESR